MYIYIYIYIYICIYTYTYIIYIHTSLCVCMCRNGSKINIYRCKSKICKMKDNSIAREMLVNAAAKRFYICLVPPSTTYAHCNTENVIYLITCDKIYLQYVEKTMKKLNCRFNWHRL